jgi:predicted RNase H-like HicB family nuclease
VLFSLRISYQGGIEMRERTFSAIIHKEEDLYVAECPEVGTVSQGHTIEEALANPKEAK